MPDTLGLGKPPEAPKPTKAAAPAGSTCTAEYSDVSGLAGFKGQNHILQSDNENSPGIMINTVGDMYLNAYVHMQLYSKTCTHNVDVKTLQYYKEVETNISGSRKETVDGDNKLICNTDCYLTVSGLLYEEINLHSAIIQNQHITIAGEQAVTIHDLQVLKVGTDQTLDVGGNQTVEVKGNYVHHAVGTTKIKADGNWEGFKLGNKNDVVVGRAFKFNLGSREEIKLGFCEDLKIAGCLEQTLAIRNIINKGIYRETNTGLRFIKNMAVKCDKGQITKAEAKLVRKNFGVWLSNHKLAEWAAKMVIIR
jgi:hypothetical protein